MAAPRVAVVAGATGLVGSHLWPLLAKRTDVWSEVVLLARRPQPDLPSNVRCIVVNFEQLGTLASLKADDYFCCLGTTLKAAGSKEAFRRVDHDYVVDIARQLKANGLQQLVTISAVGAAPDSVFFYNRVKGEAERDLAALDVPATTFLRPSLLLGERRERRLLEGAAIGCLGWTAPLWRGPLGPYRPIEASSVAQAMCQVAIEGMSGGAPTTPRIVDSAMIQTLSDRYRKPLL